MSDDNTTGRQASDEELQDLIAQTDTGARSPAGAVGKLLLWVAFAWSIFQLWIASPLPFMFNFGIFNSNQARYIHLALALFLAFAAYPALKRSPRGYIPIQDWGMALVGAFTSAYLYIFYVQISARPGQPTELDLIVSAVGIVLLLEATRRALGPPLMVVALVFLAYIFFGHLGPEVIAWKGASITKAMNHLWLTTEGVFGIALGVSTDFVFLFVLFGALLDKAGAGNYFIKVAFALLGHLRGGPAKAAVVASGMTGLISGSSIANVVTTGTFTIPLMKRVGFTSEKAGAVEVASSVNGQIMPPVMGAAAFLMVEYVGIPYIEVVKHAILPAVISYIALVYIVHLEAVKANMQALEKPIQRTVVQGLISAGISVCSIIILSFAVYYTIGWIKDFAPDSAALIVTIGVFVAYIGLLWYGARFPELELDDPNSPVVKLPEAGPTIRSGLHYLLPVIILIWFLMIERYSPGLSAFWATCFMIFILLTQKPLKVMFRKAGNAAAAFREGVNDFWEGMIAGARNMIGIAIATAAAGIIVGTVTLTGVGLVMAEFVEFISGGSLILMLFFVAIISLILGMGLPTTANYIVVSSLMAGVVVELGSQSGLIVPLIAVHMFVFYFGIMADVTPPVGLASFAAAAVSGGDPMKTGFTAFFYSLRTAALPFLFIFNTKLLLIGIDGPFDLVLTVITATLAMLIFAAATQGFFIARSRIYESVILLVIAFTLFRPGFWMDMIQPPFTTVPPTDVIEIAEDQPPNADIRLDIEGENADGVRVRKQVILPLGPPGTGEERLMFAGLELLDEDGQILVDNIGFGSPAEKAGVEWDFAITGVLVASDRMAKEWMYIPAFIVLVLIVLMQRGRRRKEPAETATA
ncbi:MAG: TRAP transporter permease [Alphaproteobacteria bacterium]|nr:TRAP transporter permease [Alphaproteobacteria bacterium]